MTNQTEPTPPVEEHYAGWNNPYRGTENHGVAPDAEALITDPVEWKGTPVELHAAAADPDPVPVRIVNQAAKERAEFRTFGGFVGGGSRSPVLGRDENRSKVTIANTSENVVYVGDDMVTSVSGFPIAAGASLTLNAENPVYVWAADDSTVALLVEYTRAV